MLVIHKAEATRISTDHKSFSSISRVLRLANRHSSARMVFNTKQAKKADGNLASVYAAMHFNLNKSSNSFRIWVRKGCSIKVGHHKELFGYYGTWDNDLELAFRSGGTRVFAFERHDYEKFNDYLLSDAFRCDWKGILPYHYKLDVKEFLRKLFRNSSEHSNADSPIFISSSFKDDMLRFTLVDCGEGFLKNVNTNEENVVSEGEAISWALNGNSVKGSEGSRTMKSLGNYCVENDGELFIVCGGSSVLFCKDGFHKHGLLPGPFRGSIINVSVKIKRPVFLDMAA